MTSAIERRSTLGFPNLIIEGASQELHIRLELKYLPATDAPEAPEPDSNGEFDEAELSIVSDRLLPEPF